MKKLSVILFFLLLIIFLDRDAISQTNYALIDKFEHLGDSIIKNTSVPGLVIGIWDYNRELIYKGAKGFSDIEKKTKMKSNLRFRIGSNTKTYVVTVLLQLVDEGKIKLNEYLSKYYPEIESSNKITIEMLCNMTSGIYNYTDANVFGMTLMTNPDKKWKPDELIDIAGKYERYFPPGKEFRYSNTNYIILGRIIEKITGSELEHEIQNRIVNKLNLKNTYLADGNNIEGEYSEGYGILGYDTIPLPNFTNTFDISWAWAAGGMISNLEDMKTYVEVLVNGTLISPDLHIKRTEYVQIPNFSGKYGLGLFYIDGFAGHNGSLMGYSSFMMHNREKKCTIIILYNAQTSTKPDDLFFTVKSILGY